MATDLSPGAVARLEREAAERDLLLTCRVADMRTLDSVPEAGFAAVVALDNALPHLPLDGISGCLRTLYTRLRPGGILLASIRDYDQALHTRPSAQPAAFFGQPGSERIVHQVWDWHGDGPDDRTYTLHLFLTQQRPAGWHTDHFTGTYHALLRQELFEALHEAGFEQVRWLMPAESGYYQPLVMAHRPA